MTICQACEAAKTNPDLGKSEHLRGCYGCKVRHYSSEPPFAIRAAYEQIRDAAELEKFKRDLRTEFDRRQALRQSLLNGVAL